jgi:hypothetical protein
LVSARTLFVAGLAIIAILASTAVVIVQQIPLQKPVTIYQPVTITVTRQITTEAINEYVFIQYYGYPRTALGSYKPKPGYMILLLYIEIQNQGYESLPIASPSGSYNFYLVANYNQQFNPVHLSSLENELPRANLLNGLRTYGYIAFELQSSYLTYPTWLIYKPETGNYNVRYVNVGLEGAYEQVSLASYNWRNLDELTITLRNDGQFMNVTFGPTSWLNQGSEKWLYVNGISPIENQHVCSYSNFVYIQLPPHQTCTFMLFSLGFAPVRAATYTLKVTTACRNVFSFSLTAGTSIE